MLISPFDPPVAKWLSAPGLIEILLIEPLWGLDERRVASEPFAKLTRCIFRVYPSPPETQK